MSYLFQVYKNISNVDDYLIESIIRPADDPNAGEVYYRYHCHHIRIITCFKMIRPTFVSAELLKFVRENRLLLNYNFLPQCQ